MNNFHAGQMIRQDKARFIAGQVTKTNRRGFHTFTLKEGGKVSSSEMEDALKRHGLTYRIESVVDSDLNSHLEFKVIKPKVTGSVNRHVA
jgi:superfamily I DNA/RNA helicase